MLHVLAGEIEHIVEGADPIRMKPGDTITIAANAWHQARNIGQAEAQLLICFSSPTRQTIGE